MCPSEFTWKDLLATNWHHQSPPTSYISISTLNYLEKCPYFIKSDEPAGEPARRGLALHAIVSGSVPMPVDIPEEERTALYDVRNKLEEAKHLAGVENEEELHETPMMHSGLRIQGTCDLIIRAAGRILVCDFKFGKGVVDSTCAQLCGYAACSNVPDGFVAHRAIIQPGQKLDVVTSRVVDCVDKVRDVLQCRQYYPSKNTCKYCTRKCTERQS